LNKFVDLASFERNLWKTDDVFETFEPKFTKSEQDLPVGIEEGTDAEIFQYFADYTNFPKVEGFVQSSERKILEVSTTHNFVESTKKFLKIPRVVNVWVYDKKAGKRVKVDNADMKDGKSVTAADFKRRSLKGDSSLYDVYGYQKVTFPDGTPLTRTKKYIVNNKEVSDTVHVYRQINLWGDGQYLAEHYDYATKSAVENGSVTVAEIANDDVIRAYERAFPTTFNKPETSEEYDLSAPKGFVEEKVEEKPVKEQIEAKREPLTQLVTLIDLEKNKSFENTIVEFVDEIASTRDIPVAFSNVRKGEKFLFVKDLFEKKFTDKAWTKPATLADGSQATPLAEDEFKSFEEFLTFGLLHEKAHEYINKKEDETVGQYEDRINQEALSRMPRFTNQLIYKDKEKRIRIEYPAEITTANGDAFKSSDLIKISKVKYDSNRLITIEDYDEIAKVYGDAVSNYAAITEGEVSIPEAEFLRDNSEFAKRFIDVFETDELGEAKTFQEYAQALLDQNEKLVDTAQLALFDLDNQNLTDADNSNPCKK
jgi:hypothetical protein